MIALQAGRILARCIATWPTMPVGDATSEVWAEALEHIDYDDAVTAVKVLGKSEEWPPALARIVAASRGVAAGHEAQFALPAPKRDLHLNARCMEAINAYQATVKRPAHDHRRGDENCPCCSTAEERIATGTRESMQLVRETQAEYAAK